MGGEAIPSKRASIRSRSVTNPVVVKPERRTPAEDVAVTWRKSEDVDVVALAASRETASSNQRARWSFRAAAGCKPGLLLLKTE